MRKTVDIVGIPVDSLTMDEAVEKAVSFVKDGGSRSIYTPNAEIMMAAKRDPTLAQILSQADMLTADGAGVVLAAKLLGSPLPAKVSGIDLVRRLFSAGADNGTKFYFLGGKPGVADDAAKRMSEAFPGLLVAGIHDGYFTPDEEPGIIGDINHSGADVLLVALGAPKQEKWINAHRHELKPNLCIGVGGSLDIFAGKAKPAPEFLRAHGLEWLYRLYREPWRFTRMLDLPRFILVVLAARLKSR